LSFMKFDTLAAAKKNRQKVKVRRRNKFQSTSQMFAE